MISFEHRILSEYRIKIAKIETLAKSILTHQDPKGDESKDASKFLDVQAMPEKYQNDFLKTHVGTLTGYCNPTKIEILECDSMNKYLY